MPKLHPLDPIVASGLVPNLLIHLSLSILMVGIQQVVKKMTCGL
jgi:hypothetical protein